MIRFSFAVLLVALSLGLFLGLGTGCSKKDGAAPDGKKGGPGPDIEGKKENPLAAEDAEVAAYIKKKGWSLNRDMRLGDLKWMVFLTVENSEKPFEDVTITDDDAKMIAKSKTVQVLNLNKVKNTSDAHLKVIAGIPQLEGILIKGEEVTDAGLKALAQCKSLENVALGSTKKVTDAGVKELAALPKLQALHLGFMTLTGEAFKDFAGAKNLESVTLEYVDGIDDQAAKHLAALPNLNALKIGKGFGESKLTAKGIKAIVDKRLPASFEFDKKLIDDDLLQALVAKGWLYGPGPPSKDEKKEKRPANALEVTGIYLSDSNVTDKGMKSVLDCTNATSISLAKTGITDETVKKLAGFKKLNYLVLDNTKVGAAGLEGVSGLPIDSLSLQGCELTEDGFKAIGKMKALTKLSLPEAKMKSAWLEHIAGLSKLNDLNLRAADFEDAAVKHVATLPSLESLSLNDTKLTDKGFAELVTLPNCAACSWTAPG
jgi:internalin A